MTYSQHKEDKWILENFPKLGIGFFVEIGGHDGITLSNTLLFENLGWKGLIIEPDPRSFKQLQINRSDCILEDCAIDSVENDSIGFYLDKEECLSGLIKSNNNLKEITVRTRRLDNLLNEYNISTVDLLSIDTESTELAVWASRGIFSPKVVIIEHITAGKKPQTNEILNQLREDGYNLVHTTDCNLIFVDKIIKDYIE